jgi:transcriptional regulator with XRE-family HTH domain
MLNSRLVGMTQTDLARDLGVSIGYLNDIIRNRREPGPKVLKALKLKRRVIYEPLNGSKR